jgi:acetyl esterase/lipase
MGQAEFVFKMVDMLTYMFVNPAHVKNISCIKEPDYNLYFEGKEDTINGKPILINIHGGGFIAGGKNCRRYLCEKFAKQGWLVVNADYRLCPEVQIVDQIKDIWNVMGKITSIAQKYGADCSTVVITGDSAGACLAAYMVTILNSSKLRCAFGLPKIKIKISGAILYCGVYDLSKMLETAGENTGFIKSVASAVTGMKLNKIEDVQAYPYYKYLSLTKFINKKFCPTLLTYAEKDIFVRGQGEVLHAALLANKVPVETHHTATFLENHCYHFAFFTKASKEALKMSYDFLDRIKKRIYK